MSEILVINRATSLLSRRLASCDATDKQASLLEKQARRDASKSGTGNRRRHNARKIAIGGTRLDSRLSDFRSATKSAENRECALNRSVSVFVDLHLREGTSAVPSVTTPRLSARPSRNDVERVYSSSSAALYSLDLFARSMFIIRWRAPPFFLSHKGRTMTAACCVRSLIFSTVPSPLSSFTSFGDLRKLSAISFAHFFSRFSCIPFFFFWHFLIIFCNMILFYREVFCTPLNTVVLLLSKVVT